MRCEIAILKTWRVLEYALELISVVGVERGGKGGSSPTPENLAILTT